MARTGAGRLLRDAGGLRRIGRRGGERRRGTRAGGRRGARAQGETPSRRDGESPTAFTLTIAAPDIPWLQAGDPGVAPPVMTPCPEGWAEVPDDGFSYCEPWAPGATVDCGVGEAQRPGPTGATGCTPLGAPCPGTGDFAEGLPTTGAIVYVLAGAGPGGDGSLGAPYATLAEAAVETLAPGTVVALGRGSYAGGVTLPAGVTLFGACAAETEVTGSAEGEPILEIAGAGVTVRDLRVGPSPGPGIAIAGDGTEVDLLGVEVSATACAGITAEGAVTMRADGLAVRDVATCAGDDTEGVALLLSNGPTATVTDALFARNALRSIRVHSEGPPTALTLSDAVLRETVWADPVLSDTSGRGTELFVDAMLDSGGTAQADVTRTLFEGGPRIAAMAFGPGAELDLEEAHMRGGTLALVAAASHVELKRSTVVDEAPPSPFEGVVAASVTWGGPPPTPLGDASLVIEDCAILDTPSVGTSSWGASMEIRRTRYARNRGGSDIVTLGGTLRLEDVRVGDTAGPDVFVGPDGALYNSGLGVTGVALGFWGPPFDHAAIEVRRLSAIRTRENALRIIGAPPGVAEADVEDVLVRDMLGPEFTGALWARGQVSPWSMRRALFDRAWGTDVQAQDGAHVVLEDTVFRGTQTNEEGLYGRGLSATSGSTIEARRVALEGHRDVSAGAWDGATLDLEDVVVERTEARACAADDGACAPAGHALGAYGGSLVSLERFSIATSDLCGVQLADDAETDLAEGEIRSTVVGVCLQVDPYDVSRLSDRVRFVDNGSNLQATRLPVPDPLGEP